MENLSGIEGLTRGSIKLYLDSAKRFLCNKKPITPDDFSDVLRGKTVGLLFFEPSTRTRASFEIAAKNLGAKTILIGAQNTSIQKGESIYDTCMNLVAMGVDLIVLRQKDEALLHDICRRVPVPIVNAGNGMDEHPTQALLDALTLLDAFESETLEGKNISIIGDISHSRVARSEILIFSKLGAKVTIAGPSGCIPSSNDSVARIATLRRDAIGDADAVVCLRVQKERFESDHASIADWTIDRNVVETEMKTDAFILHPGPVIWGEELTKDVGCSARSLILRQAGFGVAVRQAVLLKLLEIS